MADPRLLSPSAAPVQDSQVFDGIVSTDATAPDDEVFVRIPDFDDDSGTEWKHGPCEWTPRAGTDGLYYPKRGDSATVVVPQGESPVIVAWVPEATESDDPFTAGALGPETVGSAELKKLGVVTEKLADKSVTTPKLADEAVTQSKLGLLSVGTSQLANLAITESKLASGSVSESKLANNAVTSEKIKDGTIREADMAAPTFINVKDPAYGAIGNNVADDTAAINKAIAALSASGGTLFFPRGAYKVTGELNFESKVSIVLAGVGAMSSGSTPGSLIIFYQTGKEVCFNGKKTSGIQSRELTWWQATKAFEGYMFDFAESAYVTFEKGNIAHIGTGTEGKATAFNLRNSQVDRFRDLKCGGWKHVARGKTIEGDFSNVILWEQCAFADCSSYPIVNPSDTWSFINTNWQPLADGEAGAILVEEGFTARSTQILNCGFYDAETKGTWIKWRGQAFSMIGCVMGNGAVGVRITGGKGVFISGTWMQGPANGIICDGETIDIHIDPSCYFTGVAEKVVVNGVGRSDMLYTDKKIEGGESLVTEGQIVSRSGGIWGTGAIAADSALLATVSGDAFARLVIGADGKHSWGSGAVAQDVTLYRLEKDVLATDDQFRILGHSANIALLVRQAADGAARFRVANTGELTWGDGTTVDTNLRRLGANALGTDDEFQMLGARLLVQQAAANSAEAFRVNNKSGETHYRVDTENGINVFLRRASITSTSVNPMLAVNQTGTGIIADFQDNGTSVLKVDDGAKIAFFNVATVAKQAALTAANAETVDNVYGEPEANTITNLRTRVNEIETKLKAYGLLS